MPSNTITMSINLTARQATLLNGWLNPVPTITWADALRQHLTLDAFLSAKVRASDLVTLQPDPLQWVRHAGAGMKHARVMMAWEANPFVHLGADLADVILMKLEVGEMMRMGITYEQLLVHGMTERTEVMFRLGGEEEWEMLGKPKKYNNNL